MSKPHPTYGEGPTFLEPQPFNVDLTAPDTDVLYPKGRRAAVTRMGRVPNVEQYLSPDRDPHPYPGRGVQAQGTQMTRNKPHG